MSALVLAARTVAAIATFATLATGTAPATGAAPARAAAPPTRIAYSVNSSDGSRLYSTTPDGADQRTLIDPVSGTIDADPTFGPGGALAYVQLTTSLSRYELRVIEGSEPSRLVYASAQRIAEPTFSPDGKQLAFSLDTTTGETRIFAVNVDGTHARWLSGSHSVAAGEIVPVDNSPSWSPDGRRIVFSRRLEGMPPTAAIYEINTTGRPTPRALTSGSVVDFSPSWAPNGHSILFGREDDPEDIGQTWSVASVVAGGGTPTVLVPPGQAEISDLAWAPDGNRFAYVSTAPGSATSTLSVAAADGTDADVVKTVDGRLISVSWGSGGGIRSED